MGGFFLLDFRGVKCVVSRDFLSILPDNILALLFPDDLPPLHFPTPLSPASTRKNAPQVQQATGDLTYDYIKKESAFPHFSHPEFEPVSFDINQLEFYLSKLLQLKNLKGEKTNFRIHTYERNLISAQVFTSSENIEQEVNPITGDPISLISGKTQNIIFIKEELEFYMIPCAANGPTHTMNALFRVLSNPGITAPVFPRVLFRRAISSFLERQKKLNLVYSSSEDVRISWIHVLLNVIEVFCQECEDSEWEYRETHHDKVIGLSTLTIRKMDELRDLISYYIHLKAEVRAKKFTGELIYSTLPRGNTFLQSTDELTQTIEKDVSVVLSTSKLHRSRELSFSHSEDKKQHIQHEDVQSVINEVDETNLDNDENTKKDSKNEISEIENPQENTQGQVTPQEQDESQTQLVNDSHSSSAEPEQERKMSVNLNESHTMSSRDSSEQVDDLSEDDNVSSGKEEREHEEEMEDTLQDQIFRIYDDVFHFMLYRKRFQRTWWETVSVPLSELQIENNNGRFTDSIKVWVRRTWSFEHGTV